MIAAILTAPNTPLRLLDVEPHEPSFGQVLVKVIASGICGAQLSEIRGDKGSHFPRLMGHEASARVVETGVGVKTVKPGDRCVMHWRPGAGIESDFPCYELLGKTITSGLVTSFSEYALVSENRVTAVPADAPDDLCALLGCGLSTALGVIEHEANLLLGERCLIVGAGGLGLSLILAAKMRGAAEIVVVDIHESKRASVFAAGATGFLTDFWEAHEGDYQFDVVIDTTGSPEAFKDAALRLAPSGRYILVGQPKPGASLEIAQARHLFDGSGATFKATQGGCFRPQMDIPRYVAAWRAGLLKLDGIISHRLPLERINEGLDLVRAGQAGRVLIQMP